MNPAPMCSTDKKLFSRKGQSMMELAVFGGLMVVVLAAISRIGLSLFYSQSLQQTAFREALFFAEQADNRAQVVVLQDRLIPDGSPPLFTSSRNRISGSAGVLWSSDSGQYSIAGAEGFNSDGQFVYEVNCNQQQIPAGDCARATAVGDFPNNDNFRAIMPESEREVAVSPALMARAETPDQIQTRRQWTMTDVVTTHFAPAIRAPEGGLEQSIRTQRSLEWTTPTPTGAMEEPSP